MKHTTNEQKNLIRLTGEMLVSSQLAQNGYFPALQLGNIVDYDVLAFDKKGNTAFIEVKSSASYPMAWAVSSKIIKDKSTINLQNRFYAFVDLSRTNQSPGVYIIPITIVQEGLKYFYNNKFPNSKVLRFDLKLRPTGKAKANDTKTLFDFLEAKQYLSNYSILNLESVNVI